MINENCTEKVLSHIHKLDRIETPIQTTNEETILIRYNIKYICDCGEGKSFCKFIDKVVQKEKELGRKLNVVECLQIEFALEEV